MFMRMAIIGTMLVILSLMSGMWTGEKVFGAPASPIKLTDQKVFEITFNWTKGLSPRHSVMWIVHKIEYATDVEAEVDVTTVFANKTTRQVESEHRYLLLIAQGKVVGTHELERNDAAPCQSKPKEV